MITQSNLTLRLYENPQGGDVYKVPMELRQDDQIIRNAEVQFTLRTSPEHCKLDTQHGAE